VKKCPHVNRISSIFSSALQTVNQHTQDKSATGMPLQSKIALRTMNICLYRRDLNCARQRQRCLLAMGANLSGNDGGQLFSARVHRVKNHVEETPDSNERKQSASCRRSLLRGSMPSGTVRCRKTSVTKRRWDQPRKPCKGEATLQAGGAKYGIRSAHR
jgi:hypothetical protein